jgi:hypothetical protein
MPLSWMRKSEKGPVLQFIVEQLAELDTIHQYIQGPQNSIADAASRYPCLGPKRLAPRGMANSVSEMLQRLPEALKVAEDVHVYAGIHTADLKQLVLKQRFEAAGKLTILSTQLTWVIGNLSESCRIEMFAGTLATRAPITGDDPSEEPGDTFDVAVPRTMEEWLEAQIGDEGFESTIAGYDSKAIARRDGVWVYAPEGAMPRIIVPKPQ